MSSAGPMGDDRVRAALRAGARGEAEAMCRQRLARDARDVFANEQLARLCLETGRSEEAIRSYAQVVAQRPRDVEAMASLAAACMVGEHYDDARRHLERALRLSPAHPRVRATLARVHEICGDHERAWTTLAPSLDAPPVPPIVAAIAVRLLVGRGELDAAIDLGRASAASAPPTVRRPLRTLRFALAKALERAGRYDEAFDEAVRANAIESPPFDRAATRTLFDQVIRTFTRARLDRLPRGTGSSSLPVFVVGMPRSGSTLTERILAAHPDVGAAGEIGTFHQLAFALPARLGSPAAYPMMAGALTAQAARETASAYLAALEAKAGAHPRIVDKTLINFLHLGLVEALLPEARIIHCRRDPVDLCTSCFFEGLEPVQMPYASRLEDLGWYFRAYRRVMDHWAEVLRTPVHEVVYEDVVGDQETATRALLDFVGLPWDERCLAFHETKHVQRTMSVDQVRQPLYATARGRGARFGARLDPLREALAAGEGNAS